MRTPGCAPACRVRSHTAALLLSLAAVLAACTAHPETADNEAVTDYRTEGFTVIAHRGASGYLPEHTLAAAAMAHAMEADYIEQDVVMSRDGELIVLHDLTLDAVTDVAARFPGRQRDDGHFYAIDFDLAEIRTLRVHERREPDGELTFPGRFDAAGVDFRVPTLREEIALIQGLNRSTGRDVGVYVEPKSPAWHRAEGRDLLAAVVGVLAEFGYEGRDDKAFLQSFDFEALRKLRFDLGSELKLVQLIGENRWGEKAAATSTTCAAQRGWRRSPRSPTASGPGCLRSSASGASMPGSPPAWSPSPTATDCWYTPTPCAPTSCPTPSRSSKPRSSCWSTASGSTACSPTTRTG